MRKKCVNELCSPKIFDKNLICKPLKTKSSHFTSQPGNIFKVIQQSQLGKRKVAQSVDALFKENVRERNCTKKIFNGHTRQFFFRIFGDIALTFGNDGIINCLDNRTGIQLWKHEDKAICWGEKIFLTDSSCVVCPGQRKVEWTYTPIIRVLSLRTGFHLNDIEDERIDYRQVAVVGSRIFSKSNYEESPAKILEWNLEGQLRDTIPSFKSSDLTFQSFKSIDGGLISHDQKMISFIDLIGPNSMSYDLKECKIEMTKTLITKEEIIVGLNRGFDRGNDACLVMIRETGKFKRIRIPNAFLHKERNMYTDQDEMREDGYISAPIESWGGWTYLADSNGILIALNLKSEKYVELGRHDSAIFYLARENDLMATASSNEIRLWDLTTHKLLNTIYTPEITGIFLKNGKLFSSTKASFIIWDYYTVIKGEKLSANSAIEVQERDCCIM